MHKWRKLLTEVYMLQGSNVDLDFPVIDSSSFVSLTSSNNVNTPNTTYNIVFIKRVWNHDKPLEDCAFTMNGSQFSRAGPNVRTTLI
jgi:hypothetical protein